MSPLRFAPPQFEPTARLIKAEATKYGYRMDIIKNDRGEVACQFYGGGRIDFQHIVANLLDKHGKALGMEQNVDVVPKT